jgi:PTH1 family peptidyl-tRNA hydrolase
MVLDLLAERVGGRFKAHKGRADLVEGRLAAARRARQARSAT